MDKEQKNFAFFAPLAQKMKFFRLGAGKKVPLALFPFFSTQTVGLARLRETKMRRDWLRIFD
jgi:hypothetical protein